MISAKNLGFFFEPKWGRVNPRFSGQKKVNKLTELQNVLDLWIFLSPENIHTCFPTRNVINIRKTHVEAPWK